MKPIAIFALVWGLTCLAGPAAADSNVRVGNAAPDFRIDRVDGQKISLRDFRGRPVFLNFFATWCPPCKLELPSIIAQYQTYGHHVVFLGVDEQESPEAVLAFAKDMGMRYDLGIDQGNVAAAYLVQAIPTSVFIDKTGIVRAVNRGYLTPSQLQQDLTLIAGY